MNIVDCLKAALSKGLGLGIIAGSMLGNSGINFLYLKKNVMHAFFINIAVKVPQILKLYNAKSGEGLTMVSLVMELFAIAANLAYSYRNGFPFRLVEISNSIFQLQMPSSIPPCVII